MANQLSESERTIQHLTGEVARLQDELDRLKNPQGLAPLVYNIQLRDLFANSAVGAVLENSFRRQDAVVQLPELSRLYPPEVMRDLAERCWFFADTMMRVRAERYGQPAEE